MKCKNCGQELGETVKRCPICGQQQDYLVRRSPEREIISYEEESLELEVYEHQKSRLVAGLLQIFLGGFGAGRFYLGYTGVAVGQLCTLPLFGIGYIWGFIDGILILCGQVDLDAEGVPLKG